MLLLLVIALSFGLAGCNSEDVIANSYKTLKITADTYDQTMSAAGDLHRRGVIDDEVKADIIDIGNKYRTAHQVAANALESYAMYERAEDEEKIDTALAEVSRLVGELVMVVRPYLAES
jgi:hypothetical protein